MRIIFILNNTYPNGKASSTRIREYGKGFVKNGTETIVLMPQPRIPSNEKNPNPENNGIDENGVKYHTLGGSQKRNSNIFIRQLIDCFGIFHTFLWILFNIEHKDKIILYECKNIWIAFIIAISKIKRARVGLELNELPFGTGAETRKSILSRKFMLNILFPQFDFFLCISEELSNLVRKYSNNSTIIKVPVMSEGNLEGDNFPEQTIPYVFHSGALTEQKDGICGMLEAFGIATKYIGHNIQYYLTGCIDDSPHSTEIKNLIVKYHIEKQVKFLGYLDLRTLRKYQKNCFLTIINKYDTQQNRYCFSTKLSEYLSFARPVITTTIGEANMYLEDGINAFIVEPNKPELIAEKIVFAYTNPQKAKQIGENGHKLTLKEFDCIYQTKRIINLLDIH